MKDNRFIELVNLYIDRQITSAEAAELEAEMQASPRRRAIYRQYCQLHSATKQVYDRFRATALEPQPAAVSGRTVIENFKNRPRFHWVHYVGGAAAAACLALLFVRHNAQPQPGSAALARVEPKAAVPAAIAPVVLPAPAPSLVSLHNNRMTEPAYPGLLTALRQDEQQALITEEVPVSRLPSLFDDGVFEMRPVLPVNGQRTFRSKLTPAQPAEFTAFQFQR